MPFKHWLPWSTYHFNSKFEALNFIKQLSFYHTYTLHNSRVLVTNWLSVIIITFVFGSFARWIIVVSSQRNKFETSLTN